ncbi:MAG: hypothetical protein M0011_12515 [Elusimicrobia bacterium]|nr:hypothetical protein [Elusimicrobiota bacterium]
MKSFSSVLSWLLLLAVLAVPSFLFYNWWSKGKKQASLEIAQVPVTANVFPKQASPSSPPAPAPQSPSQPAASAAPAAIPKAQDRPSAAANAPVVEEDEADGEEPAAPERPVAAQKPAAVSTAPAAGEARPEGAETVVSTAPKPISYYSPKSERDPTLTPDDYRRIAEAKRAREESERQYELMQTRKTKEPGPETLIRLQGIVGNSAIINDDMYTAGQKVKGIKILKIGANYIICEYKGKRFKKVMR